MPIREIKTESGQVIGHAMQLDLEGARWIQAKYDGRCVMMRCGAEIEAGDRILYLPSESSCLCVECAEVVT